jgi:predicted NBD/HSP70 family sugar kinase
MAKARLKPAAAAIQSSLVRRLRLGRAVSRVELARQLKLAPSTIGLYVDGLIADGFLVEARQTARTGGRPPKILELNPHAGRFVGIDFEARTLRAIAVDFSQQTLDRREYDILHADGVDDVLAKIETALREIGGKGRALLGIGIAVPGVIDAARGLAVHYRHLRGWRDVPLVARLSRKVRRPIYLENNIRALALAEQWFGQGRALSNFLCLGVRSGIGAGVVVDGRLLHGAHNLAGEIGGLATRSAAGGQAPTLEEQASVTAVVDRLTAAVRAGRKTSLPRKRQRLALDDVLRAAREGDELTHRVLDDAARAIGRAVGEFSLLLNPEGVIVAGPFAELGESFLAPIRDEVDQSLAAAEGRAPRVTASELGAFGGAIGAAALAVHQWLPAAK